MSLEFRRASEFSAEQFADVWSKWVPEKYWVDAEVLGHLGAEHPCSLVKDSFAALRDGVLVGFYELKDSAAHLFDGPSPDDLHLQSFAFGSHEVGVRLMEHLKVQWAGSGRTVYFGRGHGHLFPGVPTDWPEMMSVLAESGFAESDGLAYDVEADLANRDYGCPLATGVEVVVASADDQADADRFFREEFPGRWRYDTLARLAVNPSDIALLKVDGRVEGFAFLQGFFSPCCPVAGGVWRHSLGPDWGALGPIGVSKGVRGQGLGGALLSWGLQLLKERGVQRCIIDWTTLVDFYGKYGFHVSRTYATYSLRL